MLQPLPDPVVDPEVVDAWEGGATGPPVSVHRPVVSVFVEISVGDGGVHPGGAIDQIGVLLATGAPEALAVLSLGGAAGLGGKG